MGLPTSWFGAHAPCYIPWDSFARIWELQEFQMLKINQAFQKLKFYKLKKAKNNFSEINIQNFTNQIWNFKCARDMIWHPLQKTLYTHNSRKKYLQRAQHLFCKNFFYNMWVAELNILNFLFDWWVFKDLVSYINTFGSKNSLSSSFISHTRILKQAQDCHLSWALCSFWNVYKSPLKDPGPTSRTLCRR